MNIENDLTTCIVAYLFDKFGVLDVRPISLRHEIFRTKHLVEFLDERDREEATSMFACQTVINGTNLKIAYVELSCKHSDYADIDMVLIIQLEGCPIYGCFLSADERRNPYSGFIACKFKDAWMSCSIDIQATFLAGMERTRDIITQYNKCQDNQELYQNLKDFIKYQETFLEIQEAGQNEED